MTIQTITVSSTRKLPHPNADYASISGAVSLTAAIQPGEDWSSCTTALQRIADELVETHMARASKEMTRATPGPEAATAKAQNATAKKADRLVEKHGRF